MYLEFRVHLEEGSNSSDAQVTIILLNRIIKYFSFREIDFSVSFVQNKRKSSIDRLEQVRFLWRHLVVTPG